MDRDWNKDPLKVVTTFSGMDAQCLALERLKENFPLFNYELLAWSEIDKHAIEAHNILFPQWSDRNLGDVTKVDWKKVHKEVGEIDLFTYSSPCFVAGTLIHTEEGFKPIEDIKVGDKVLSHDNQYYAVEKAGHKSSTDMYKVVGSMFDEIICTGEHPFYTRERYRYGHNGIRAFREPRWVNAQDLNNNLYLGYAINTKSELPHWEGSIDKRWRDHRKVNNLQPVLDNPMFWYLMGRYVGDGWKKIGKSGNGIIICCSSRNEDSLLNAISGLGWKACKSEERTVRKYTICSNELCSFVKRYGYYAHGKQVDEETMALPTGLLKSFIQGVIDSDGCYTNNEYKISSVSRTLVYGLQQCIAKVYHRPVKMYKYKRPCTCVIEGRVVNQRDTYTIVWHNPKKQDKAFYEDGYVWFPLQKIEKLDETDIVYNIQVAESHSYTANGAIVHNCQDWSIAGMQKGGAEGSGTRSSLLWECRKAISDLRPKYLMLENVRNLVSKKFISYFRKWCDDLTELGYMNFWKVLNAKDYGIPQNRERVFLVSIREDCSDKSFRFPDPIPYKDQLIDLVEKEVADRYYLSEGMVEKFFKHNETQLGGFAFKPREIEEGGGIASCLRAKTPDGHTDNMFIEYENRNVFGLSRSRDKYGNVIKLSESDYVMCIHSRVSFGHDNMWVLIGEESIKKTEHMEKTKKPEGKGWMWSEEKNKWYRIRRLTPRDALRIMDVDSKYVDLLMGTMEKKGNPTRLISDNQLYKIAGNSIVVNCLHLIFRNMFFPGMGVMEKNGPIQLSLF